MKKSYLIAISLSVIIVLWMLSGMLTSTDNTGSSQAETSNASASEDLFSVKVQTFVAQETELLIKAQGEALPNRIVTIRAQTEGQVTTLLGKEGAYIAQGKALVQIDIDDREQLLAQQKALLAANQKTYQRFKKLEGKQFQSEGELETAFANLKASEASVAQIQRDIKRTTIVAPLNGLLERHLVEQGDFVQVNTPVATIIENNPLIVSIPVAQQDIANVSHGVSVNLSFATGHTLQGDVSYISPRANAATRAFTVEVSVDNSEMSIPSGVSVEAKIPSARVKAHYVSLALLSLNDEGIIGIKTVNAQSLVEFYPIEILASDTQGSWVKGLPNSADVIVVGQGFVKAGNKVNAVSE